MNQIICDQCKKPIDSSDIGFACIYTPGLTTKYDLCSSECIIKWVTDNRKKQNSGSK